MGNFYNTLSSPPVKVPTKSAIRGHSSTIMVKDSSISTSMQRLQGDLMKRVTGYRTLKSFIRELRACPTPSDERDLMCKELASIRTILKTTLPTLPLPTVTGGSGGNLGSSELLALDLRWQSMAKVIYLSLLTSNMNLKELNFAFAQVEALKMCGSGSGRLRDKRLGWLGVAQLVDEHQETLTLSTNSLKFDLNASNEQVVALALSALSTIASKDVARDLADEVARLLKGQTTIAMTKVSNLDSPSIDRSGRMVNVRKRAALCAVRLIGMDAELADLFFNEASELLAHTLHPSPSKSVPPFLRGRGEGYPGRNGTKGPSINPHALLLSACHLMQVIVDTGTINPEHLLPLIPTLLRQLTILTSSNNATDANNFDVNGINDPFLQCAILKLLKALLLSCIDIISNTLKSDVNETLIGFSRNYTDPLNQAAHAVTFEFVDCVLSIDELIDAPLRSIAVVSLKKLLNGDNNLRFVSLSLLSKSAMSMRVLLEYQSNILACLQEHDISIRRQASHLALRLCNQDNIQEVMECLLEMSDVELYEGMERVARQQSIGEYYAHFLPKLLGLIDTECDDAFGEERREAMVVRACKAIKEKGLLSIAIKGMMSKSREDGKVCTRRVLTWCCGEFYAFAGEEERKEIVSYFKGIQTKPDPYLLIALAKLSKEGEGLMREMGSSMRDINCIQTKILKNVIWAAMKADPSLVLLNVTPQKEAIPPILPPTDILSMHDTPGMMDISEEHKSHTSERDPFDFW